MKIVFLTRFFFPHIGGVEKHVEKLSYELIKKGHEITVVTEKFDKSLSDKEKKDDVLIYRIPTRKNKRRATLQIWVWLFKHRTLLKNADIVHAHDVYFWYFPFRLFLPRKKSFVTFHGYESFPISSKAKRIRRLSAFLAKKNISVGRYIEKWYGTNADVITYGAVDSKDTFSEMKKTKEKTHIVFLGRIAEDTGVKEYAKVLKRLQEKKLSFTFNAYGRGSLTEIFEEFGGVSQVMDPLKCLKSADVVFASSYLSILEALVCKKFVVAICTNPLKKDYLLLTPFKDYIAVVGSIDEAAKLVSSYISSPQKFTDVIEGGYQWVKGQSWENMADTYVSLWEK